MSPAALGEKNQQHRAASADDGREKSGEEGCFLCVSSYLRPSSAMTKRILIPHSHEDSGRARTGDRHRAISGAVSTLRPPPLIPTSRRLSNLAPPADANLPLLRTQTDACDAGHHREWRRKRQSACGPWRRGTGATKSNPRRRRRRIRKHRTFE